MIIFDITLVIISFILSTYGLYYFSIHTNKNITFTNKFINLAIFLIFSIFYFNLLVFSSLKIVDQTLALIFWEVTIVLKVTLLSVISSLQLYMMIDHFFRYIPLVFYAFLLGIIFSLILPGNSFRIVELGDFRYFYFQNILLLFFIFVLDLVIVALLWLMFLVNYKRMLSRGLLAKFLVFIVLNSATIASILLYFISQIQIIKYIHLILFLTTAFLILQIIVKEPGFFIVIRTHIENLVIFHRSGILLYSYDFEQEKEIDDSLLKGSILIGISHILANFADKKEQLNLIKMKNRDIVFEYDNEYGYALLLITNRRSTVINKIVAEFIQKFRQKNQEELNKINKSNQLIDISKFKNTKSIILECFSPYLKK